MYFLNKSTFLSLIPNHFKGKHLLLDIAWFQNPTWTPSHHTLKNIRDVAPSISSSHSIPVSRRKVRALSRLEWWAIIPSLRIAFYLHAENSSIVAILSAVSTRNIKDIKLQELALFRVRALSAPAACCVIYSCSSYVPSFPLQQSISYPQLLGLWSVDFNT